MSCASCVNKIQKKLLTIPGIENATILLTTEQARIIFNPNITTESFIIKTINELGYKASAVEENKKQNKKNNRDLFEVILSLTFSLPLLIPMLSMLFDFHFSISWELQLILATFIQFYFGRKFYRGTYFALKSKTGNMDVLVSLGTTAAYGLSLFEILTNPLHPNLYFESSAMIITLVLMGKLIEKNLKTKTVEAIEKLKELVPKTALLIKDGSFLEISAHEIKQEDIIFVRPGDQIPIDGIILEGESDVDESLLQGEARPVTKKVSQKAYAGTINLSGSLKIKCVDERSQFLIHQIIHETEKIQMNKTSVEVLVDKISSYFVPFILILSSLTFIAYYIFENNPSLGLINAVSVLVLACPCAMGLATPTSLIVGNGLAIKNGILVRDPKAFELTHKMKTAVFDKTGTITEGRPMISEILTKNISEEKLIEIAAKLEATSSHPYAKAIKTLATFRGIDFSTPIITDNLPGIGLVGKIDNINYLIAGGNGHFENLSIEDREFIEKNTKPDFGVCFVINQNEKKLLGIIFFEDRIKEQSFIAIQYLKKCGIKTILLSGDHIEMVKKVALEVGFDEFKGGLLPNQKTIFIRELKAKENIVAMIGDGLNDGPALSEADISFSMGSGTQLAIQSSDIVITDNNPLKVIVSMKISEKTYQKIKQNLFWAFGYNIIFLPLAAFGKLNPMIAGSLMAISSVTVLLNSLSLKNWKNPFKAEEKKSMV